MGEKPSCGTNLLMMRAILICGFLLLSQLAVAGTSDRLEALERRIDVVTDLTLRVEQLQISNNQLRGEVDVLRHELELLKEQQREMYLDIERRLGRRK
jgi:cell division protein FtsB